MFAEFLLSIAPSKSVSEKPLIEVIGVLVHEKHSLKVFSHLF